MTTHRDAEWEGWTQAWSAEGAPAPEVRSRLEASVRRASLMMILGAVAEGALAVGLLALSFLVAARNPNPVIVTWAGAIWLFTAIASGFSLWNRKGIWHPEDATTEAFIALSRERCLRKLRTVRFARFLIVAELIFLIPWGCWEYLSNAEKVLRNIDGYLLRYGLIGLFIIAATLWSVWYGRRARRELAALEESRREAW